MPGVLIDPRFPPRWEHAAQIVEHNFFNAPPDSGNRTPPGYPPRLLQTCKGTGNSTYPSSPGTGPSGTPPTGGNFCFYWARFVQPTFPSGTTPPSSYGPATIQYTATTEPQVLVGVLGTSQPDEGTVLLALFQNDFWWAIPGGGEGTQLYQLREALTPGSKGPVNAYPCKWNGTIWTVDTTVTPVQISDPSGQSWGVAGERLEVDPNKVIRGKGLPDSTGAPAKVVFNGQTSTLTLAFPWFSSVYGSCLTGTPSQIGELSPVGIIPDVLHGYWACALAPCC
jgi:hypothetical protein